MKSNHHYSLLLPALVVWSMVAIVKAASLPDTTQPTTATLVSKPAAGAGKPDANTGTTVSKIGKCVISCIDPHACCEESKKVIGILHNLLAAYTVGDLKAYEEYLDDNCSMFEEGTKRLIAGKASVMSELRKHFNDFNAGGSTPLVNLTIDQPYAKVTNDTCVVTFSAMREIGGAAPRKEQAQITDVFIKRDDQWKKLHWSGKWEPVSGK
ncbi:MAG: nuclear transport factor 2 family protein [Candidatus Melainabacteria bacterium]|nr:nuclear transport factor 2 family protein [Candidatus Melainabacteria bacterium]